MEFCNKYAFIDESGNSDINVGRMLVISAVVTDDPIQLARILKSAERKNRNFRKKEFGEMKAKAQLPYIRRKVFSQILKCDFSVYSLIFDLSTISNLPYKFDDIYTVGMSMLCKKIYSVYPGIHFILDKRYTKESLRNLLSQSIKETIEQNCDTNASEIDIIHGDSIEYAELRSADYTAYETYQKYKFGSDVYDIFTDRVESVLFYANTTWGKIKKESKTPQI